MTRGSSRRATRKTQHSRSSRGDSDLLALAREAGLLARWTDASGAKTTVSADTIRSVLLALGLPSDNPAAIRDSRQCLRETRSRPPSLLITTPGASIEMDGPKRSVRLQLEGGSARDLSVSVSSTGASVVEAPREPGYHEIECGSRLLKIAVAPRRLHDRRSHERIWGVVAQIYSLPGGTTREFGDFSALKELCQRAGESGASAVAISPVHALLPWSLANYSPYAPSSRQFLNPMFASLGRTMNSPSTSSLIHWNTAYPRKLKALETCYQTFKSDSREVDKFRAFVEQGSDQLLAHARFEVLHARFAKQGLGHWRKWPEAFRDSQGPAVRALDPSNPEIEFHLYAQWRAASDLADAHRTAKSAGMDIGLIADLAVGIDPNGSDAWSRPGDMLCGLTIGAPPDALGPDGQDWGLTTFAPQALRRTGFDGFLSTLRAVLRPAGGIRIDHAMGFGRLWVVPEGASSRSGVYLTYPFEELMALTTLEASRYGAAVIAEDLGTVPAGFRAQLARRNFRGMRVLWFERDRTGSFLPSRSWERSACAMTSTHDLPTIAGWWRGHDIAWRARLSHEATPASAKRAKRAREGDRKRLWKSLKKAKCVAGTRPPATQAHKLVDGVLRFVARAGCEIALFPLEDVVGAVEQPNLPGTVDTHPNWRQRFGADALASKTSRLRLALIEEERRAVNPGRPPLRR